jgi:adenine deaminase
MASEKYPYEEEFKEIEKGMQVALGEIPADLVLRRTKLVNVFSEEIYPADICISGQKIVALVEPGTADGMEVIDCDGLFAVPGLIDGHVHIESSALALSELVRIIVPQGDHPPG